MRKRVTLPGLLQAAAAMTVLFSVVTAFDSIHYSIELFAHFRLQYLVVAVLLAIALLLLRSRAYAGILILVAILNAAYVLPWYVADTPEASGRLLRIAHANVHSSSTDYDRLLEFVAKHSPDIVFLQEINDAWLDATTPLAAEYPFHYAEPRDGNFGIAMFSRIPFDAVTHVDSPPLGYPVIVASVQFADRSLKLVSVHPTIPLGGSGYAARNEQLNFVKDLLPGTQDATVVIGDLNMTMWSHSYRSFLSGTGLRDARKGFGVLPTWPTFMPFAMIPIDHALISESLSVSGIETGKSIGSDHLPLILTVAL